MKKLVLFLIGLLVFGLILTTAIDKNFLSITKYLNSPGKGTDVYETTLSAGHYTAGIDIPPGTYSISHLSGIGKTSSNKFFSGAINGRSDLSLDSLKTSIANVQLPEDTVLTITGSLVVKISTETGNLKYMHLRENPAPKTIILSSGLYKSGQDFAEGTYNVVWMDGFGIVSSSNLFNKGLAEQMGFDALSAQEFKNLELPAGTTLTVSDLTIKLVPSK
ncbi:hypothetical protein [Acetobacterium woodii]|uniref:hypothetical protein n=1 Tax=Acetobacterium woodii TaxID=33952 RepID=UPI00031B23A3|nr:hypothetical protein [Acetobacterium woodii]